MATKIKVFIVDDSMVFVNFLTRELPKSSDRIEIVGWAGNAADAMVKIPSSGADVVTMDVEMPKMNGIDFLKEFLPKHLIPVILVSSLNVGVFDALANGAVDFVKKPDMSHNYSTRIFVQSLSSKIIGASKATVRLPRVFRGSAAVVKPQVNPAPVFSGGSTLSAAKPQQQAQTLTPAQAPTVSIKTPVLSSMPKLTGNKLKLDTLIIALGASTGGTEATLQVLEQLPADTPGMVITQHMPEGFTNMYAQRLNRLCKMEVREAVNGDVVHRGLALIAPGGECQMKVVRLGGHYTVRIYPAEKVSGHRPSVDVLFRSVAEAAKAHAVGIILTGMGQDGAYGLLEMKKAGAFTIGQDKASCVVYGMPMVAQNIGAVTVQASCTGIPSVLINHLNSMK